MSKILRSLLELFFSMALLTPLIAVMTIVVKLWWSMIIMLWGLW